MLFVIFEELYEEQMLGLDHSLVHLDCSQLFYSNILRESTTCLVY
ncbi:unnamed protein product [Meloidogyne enterolobii]|uniref:Uncharacterized protein n=2 Tax=Meloidogyne enterolobii TaxID=390850 RepID=A0ACB0XTA4_MELEN|nr:unnamed protein product [Meloidogyne enterolobii]